MREKDDRHIAIGAAMAACIGMSLLTGVQAVLPGTQRDLHALLLISEIEAAGPDAVADWLCRTKVGGEFRLVAREVLATRGIDSSSFCDEDDDGR